MCGVYEVNGIYQVNAKVDSLTKKNESLIVASAAIIAVATSNYELCGTPGHNTPKCHIFAGIPSDQVYYAQRNPYSNTYNPDWRNHPKFSYKSNNVLFPPNPTPDVPLGYQRGARASPQAPKKSNLKLILENFIATQSQQNKEFTNQNIHTNELIKQ